MPGLASCPAGEWNVRRRWKGGVKLKGKTAIVKPAAERSEHLEDSSEKRFVF